MAGKMNEEISEISQISGISQLDNPMEIQKSCARVGKSCGDPKAIHLSVFLLHTFLFLGVLSVFVCKISEAFGWHDQFG